MGGRGGWCLCEGGGMTCGPRVHVHVTLMCITRSDGLFVQTGQTTVCETNLGGIWHVGHLCVQADMSPMDNIRHDTKGSLTRAYD